MKTKNLFVSTLAALCLCASAVNSSAQSNTPPATVPPPASAPPAGVVVVPGAPGTPAINPNGASFTNVNLELYTGVGYQSGTTSATQAKTGISYNLFNGFGPALEIANEGSGNVVAEMDAFFEYHKRVGSFELIGGIGAGYNWDAKHVSGLAAVGINYNLTQIGSTFEYVGTRTEFSESFAANSRPSITPMIIVGVAF